MVTKSIKHFDGLYGDLNFTKRDEYVFVESIETRSAGFDWNIETHIHANLYQFFFIQQGIVEFSGTAEKTRLNTPCVLIIPPNTIHGFKFSSDVKGKILTMSDIVVESICKTTPAVLVRFEKFHYFCFSNTSDCVFHKTINMFQDIEEEYFCDKPEKKAYLRSYFLQLFIYLLRQLDDNNCNNPRENYKALQYFHKFQILLKKSDYVKNIPSYSSELGITPVHLNRICKEIVGKSTLFIIQENKIEQAKKYLVHTNYSVSEIAYKTGFEYPNYFTRLFKKITGLKPTEFRQNR